MDVGAKPFFQPFSEEDITELEALSDRVDAPWALHTEQLARYCFETEDTLPPSTLHNSSIKRRNPGPPGDRGHPARVGAARRPALHAKTLLAVLRKFAAHPKCLGDLGDDFHVTGH